MLECGILAHGFLRLRCGDCGHDKLVAFYCMRRGLCPSCGARAWRRPPRIEKILTHPGLQADCGRRSAPARGPAPQEGLALASASAVCKTVRRRMRLPVGRSCTRPDHPDSSSFKRPGAQRSGIARAGAYLDRGSAAGWSG
ncbi:MAG: transposase zinc-binding domain-containing protein [Proteobacteria bacterium]|nr:transposase zinc-binding domain-containing protein [Pseudomonadota bacterium]